MNWKKVKFAVEVGGENDIDDKIFVEGNDLFKVINCDTVEKITANEFKKITGIGIRAVKKEFKDGGYFIPLPEKSKWYCKEDFENDGVHTEGIGLYLETDHLELVECGCYNENMKVINGGD